MNESCCDQLAQLKNDIKRYIELLNKSWFEDSISSNELNELYELEKKLKGIK